MFFSCLQICVLMTILTCFFFCFVFVQVNVNPEDLIPKLPKPKDLQPFPTTQSLVRECWAGLGSVLAAWFRWWQPEEQLVDQKLVIFFGLDFIMAGQWALILFKQETVLLTYRVGEKDQKTNIFVVETLAFSDSRGCKTTDMKRGLSFFWTGL